MNVQRYARVAGVLFLISLVAGGLGEAYIPSRIIASGDAAATVANIRNFNMLYRLGFATFMIESLCDITFREHEGGPARDERRYRAPRPQLPLS